MVRANETISKRVRTLDQVDLQLEMKRLWDLVISAGVSPDLLVGVATGGELCAREISHMAPAGMKSVALRRRGTEVKRRFHAARLLARLPYVVTDRVRVFEDRMLEQRAAAKGLSGIAPTTEELKASVAKVTATVLEKRIKCVLVVDDAVDSGATLGRVVVELRSALPVTTRIVTAVLTQTRASPVFVPDFRLHYCVLLRFPWSFDFRGNR